MGGLGRRGRCRNPWAGMRGALRLSQMPLRRSLRFKVTPWRVWPRLSARKDPRPRGYSAQSAGALSPPIALPSEKAESGHLPGKTPREAELSAA